MTQEAFKAWWYNEGSQTPYTHHDCEEHTMRMCEIAWNKAQSLAQPEQEPVISKWVLREVYFDEDGEPIMHRSTPQPERHELQAKGEHPAPCARFCEANAFKIVIKNLKAQLAKPEQEPVGEVSKAGFGDYPVICWRTDYVAKIGDKFYTTPPQRKPLTDEEIDALAIDKDGLPNSHLEFARAIEAAHGIKE